MTFETSWDIRKKRLAVHDRIEHEKKLLTEWSVFAVSAVGAATFLEFASALWV